MQAHGSKVYYRNIYSEGIRETRTVQLSPEEEKEGFKVFCLTERICMNGLEIQLIISWKTAVSLWFQAVASEVICTPRGMRKLYLSF